MKGSKRLPHASDCVGEAIRDFGKITFKSLVENLNDGLAVIDKQRRLVFSNAKFAAMVGYSIDELMGMDVFYLFDEENQQILLSELRKRAGGVSSVYEIVFTSKSGEKVPALMRATPLLDEKKEHIGSYAVITDMSAIKKVERELLGEKEKLENIVKGIGAGLSLLDSETKLIWANDILQSWFGPMEKIKGRPCHELYDLKDPEKECAALRTLRSGQIERGESFAYVIGGEKRYFQLTTTPVRDAEGRIVQIVELTQDITEKKRLELELQDYARNLENKVQEKMQEILKSEEDWKRTFDSITDLISIHDRDFRIIRANKAFVDKFGLPREEIVGKHCYEVFHGRSSAWPACPHRETIATGKPAMEEVSDPNLGGIFSMITSPIFDGNKVVGSVHVCRDITRRKNMEMALKSSRAFMKNILDSSADAIITTNMKGEITSWNRGAERMYGHSAENMIGKSILNIYPNSLKEERVKWHDELLGGEGSKRRKDEYLSGRW